MPKLQIGAAALVVSLFAVLLIYGVKQQNLQRLETPLLPVTFAHADHVDHNCALCHHNFTDTTGQGFCYDCHKTDPTIAAQIEPMFHGLCRDCHVEQAYRVNGPNEHGDHGPTRACQQCHVADLRP